MIFNLIDILFWILGIYLMLNCIYLAFFAVIALLPVPSIKYEATVFKKTVVLFPTYRDNIVVIESVSAALKHQYKGLFEVVVIADGLAPATIQTLQGLGARTIVVQFEKSTKGKALNYAMNALKEDGFEMAVVLDVDNVMNENCLNEMNNAMVAGFKVVQVHRTAKNIDSNFAFLDACNEEINNQIYRKGPAVLGLSASLIGSGIAFDFDYYLHLLQQVGDTIGEDKQLDFIMAQDKVAVAYLNNVYVFDEKIQDAKGFTKQRTRWIASQIEFLRKYAFAGLTQLFKGNIEFFNKTLQTFLLPRMLLLGFLFLLLIQAVFNPFGPNFLFWFCLFVLLCLSLLIAVPLKYYKDKRMYVAIFQIPRAIIGMFVALLSIGKAKKSFLVTEHRPSQKRE